MRPSNAINSGTYTIDADTAVENTFTFPYPIADRYIMLRGGAPDDVGGTDLDCIHTVENVDADTVVIYSAAHDGTACDEEYTVLVF